MFTNSGYISEYIESFCRQSASTFKLWFILIPSYRFKETACTAALMQYYIKLLRHSIDHIKFILCVKTFRH